MPALLALMMLSERLRRRRLPRRDASAGASPSRPPRRGRGDLDQRPSRARRRLRRPCLTGL